MSVKAQELEKSAEETLHTAGQVGKQSTDLPFIFILSNWENLGGQKLEDTKQWLSEKGSEAKAKGAEILGATQQVLATGAAKVAETAHNAQGT